MFCLLLVCRDYLHVYNFVMGLGDTYQWLIFWTICVSWVVRIAIVTLLCSKKTDLQLIVQCYVQVDIYF